MATNIKEEQQKIVDFVALAMAVQDCKSYDGHISRYISADGSRCAVGWVLPDECAREGAGVEMLALPPHLAPHASLLAFLQEAHDRSADGERFMERFARQLEIVCERYGLRFPSQYLAL